MQNWGGQLPVQVWPWILQHRAPGHYYARKSAHNAAGRDEYCDCHQGLAYPVATFTYKGALRQCSYCKASWTMDAVGSHFCWNAPEKAGLLPLHMTSKWRLSTWLDLQCPPLMLSVSTILVKIRPANSMLRRLTRDRYTAHAVVLTKIL